MVSDKITPARESTPRPPGPQTPRQNSRDLESSDSEVIGLDSSAPGAMPDLPNVRPPSKRRGSSSAQSRRLQQAQSQSQQPPPSQSQHGPYSPIAGPSYVAHSTNPDNGHGYGIAFSPPQGYVNPYTMNHPPPQSMQHPAAPQQYASFSHYHPGVASDTQLLQNYHPHPSANAAHVYQSAQSSYGQSNIFHPGNPSSPPPTMSPHIAPATPTIGQSQSSFSSTNTSYHSMRYTSPISPGNPYAPFGPPQSFPTSPVYQSQFPAPPYSAPAYAPPVEPEGQPLWWYLPPGVQGLPASAQQQTSQYHGQLAPQHQQFTYPTLDPSPITSQAREGLHYPSSSAPPATSSRHQNPPQSSHPSGPSTPFSNPSREQFQSPQRQSTRDMESSGDNKAKERSNVVRKAYHPSPPAHRTEWVMWVGNVPSDATHDELWKFFNDPNPPSAQRPLSHSQGSSVSSSSSTQQSESSVSSPSGPSGVTSVFLISRSSCAFVNYEQEENLNNAINKFNGLQLRPHDPRCPRLVCRARRRDDDLKAGVGGQRGIGMHIRYVKERQKAQEGQGLSYASLRAMTGGRSEDELSSVASEDRMSSVSSIASVPSLADGDLDMRGLSLRDKGFEGQDHPHGGRQSSGSASFASTTSSLLQRHFPQRFFILKSLSQYDLDLSVEKGMWATQKHNEGILDKAYRTSKEVFLIFGVNKSGEFYGYAKMVGPVRQGQHKVPWEKRTDSPSSSRSSIPLSPITGRANIQTETIDENTQIKIRDYFPSRMVEESPQPMSLQEEESEPDLWQDTHPETRSEALGKRPMHSGVHLETYTAPPDAPGGRTTFDGKRRETASLFTPSASIPNGNPVSAPAEVHQEHRKLTLPTPVHPNAPRNLTANDVIPETRPDNRVKSTGALGGVGNLASASGDNIQLDHSAPLKAMKHPSDEMEAEVNETKDQARLMDGATADGGEDSWGEPFKVEWVCTDRLPFFKTRHLRNAWNHDREVKVSRDGTELEPKVGQQLLEEWVSLAEAARNEAPPSRRQQQQTSLPRSISGS